MDHKEMCCQAWWQVTRVKALKAPDDLSGRDLQWK